MASVFFSYSHADETLRDQLEKQLSLLKRQGIIDSWPEDVNDSAARRDWGFSPTYDFDRAFSEYLIPNIRQRYAR